LRKPLRHVERKIILYLFLTLLVLSVVVTSVRAVAPVADFTWSPEEPFVNETVVFDASSSYDPDGTITVYSWEIVGGPYRPVYKIGMIINYTFKSPDPYTITLTVIDNEDLADRKVEIVEARPYTAQAISVSPSEKKYVTNLECFHNNTEFSVDLVITNITECAGYQFKFDYNSTLLAVVNKTLDTDPANPLSPTQMAPLPNQRLKTDMSTLGSVRLAIVWRAGVPVYTYSGDSVAARITFRIIYCPPQNEMNNTVSCVLAFDPAWTRGTDLTGNDIPILEFNNGYYEYATLVKLVGDVDGDLDVDLDDQHQIQLAMFTMSGDSRWNPYADIAEDFDVDVGDQRKQRLNMYGSY
jgi:hypothetical protein